MADDIYQYLRYGEKLLWSGQANARLLMRREVGWKLILPLVFAIWFLLFWLAAGRLLPGQDQFDGTVPRPFLLTVLPLWLIAAIPALNLAWRYWCAGRTHYLITTSGAIIIRPQSAWRPWRRKVSRYGLPRLQHLRRQVGADGSGDLFFGSAILVRGQKVARVKGLSQPGFRALPDVRVAERHLLGLLLPGLNQSGSAKRPAN